MKKSIKFLPLLSMGLVVVGCQDYDAGFTESDIKAKQYANDFQKTFGNVDPNQDWSMAQNVKVNFMIGNNPVAEFYTGKPGYAGTRFVGLAKDNIKNIAVVTGTNQVYAVVTENGKQLVAGYFDVIDGVVNVSDKPVAKMAAGQTRAEGDPTLGAKLFTHVAYDAELTVSDKVHQYNPWGTQEGFAYFQNDGTDEDPEWYLYWAPDLNTPFRKIAYNVTPDQYNFGYAAGKVYYADDNEEAFTQNYPGNYIGSDDNGNPTLKGPFASVRNSYDAPYYRISDTQTDPATWIIGDCKTLFWEDDACFLEKEDYRSARKQAVYEKYGTDVEELSKGVEFTTVRDDQNINIPMMYGVTVKGNVFGYYYYEDGQDRRSVNRYVLFDDASPTANISINGVAVGGQELASQGSHADDDVVTCVTRRLVYFGKDGKGVDGNGTGTFNFPKDVHIGFFIMKNYSKGNDWSGLNGPTALESWSYSCADLNELYFNNASGPNSTLQQFWGYTYGNDVVEHIYGTPGEKDKVVEDCDGRVKAITWQYNGKILVGFGDDSGDEDLNDFVFWYDGEVKQDEKPKINITTDEEILETNWLIACEDLGGTFDYDFNDVVWEFKSGWKKITTTTTTETSTGGESVSSQAWEALASISLLAAGGTLPAELIYDTENFGEVHQLFGQGEADVYDIVNARSITKQPVLLKTFSVDEATALFETETQKLIMSVFEKFKVKVTDANGVTNYVTAPSISAPSTGDDNTPEMILLPYNWEWPTENTFINDAYPEFKSWVNTKTWEDWSNVKVSGKTVSRN